MKIYKRYEDALRDAESQIHHIDRHITNINQKIKRLVMKKYTPIDLLKFSEQAVKSSHYLSVLELKKNAILGRLNYMKHGLGLDIGEPDLNRIDLENKMEVEQNLSQMLGNISFQNEPPETSEALPQLGSPECEHKNAGDGNLQPYIHQVGGHSSMLCFDEKRVCKPVLERELAFYRSIPEQLKPYTPIFYGIVEVNVLFDGEFMCLVASDDAGESVRHNSRSGRIRLRRSGSVEVLPTQCQFEDEISNGTKGTTGMNPWVLKCHKDHLAILVKSIVANQKPQNFLVLENLTSSIRFPCILDLKMGTRQYDEMDSLAKRQSKMFKVVTTTTGKLGLRIAGMQVYQITTGKFLCRNKLYGRALTPAGFSLAMRQFLHDGVRVRTELLAPFIRKLEGLAGTLGELNSLRLYTTSLLLIYEGDSTTLIHTQDRLKEKRDSVIRSRGVSLDEELIDMECEEIARSTSAESITSLLEGVTEVRSSRYHGRRRSSSCAGQPRSSSDVGLCDQLEEEPLVDVRLIDFAHSSHAGMGEFVASNGPDEGFLFGLDNIISILQGIEREFSC